MNGAVGLVLNILEGVCGPNHYQFAIKISEFSPTKPLMICPHPSPTLSNPCPALAPTSFHQMINVKFKEVLGSGCIFIYMNNIIILRDTLEELCIWTKQVLETMQTQTFM